ncbi:MAG TPA: GNAT family N-acetyltransferase [Pseudonocardia sp.]|nr:GNAT family N-acetyltransferase [Pseudonocardia sp.]
MDGSNPAVVLRRAVVEDVAGLVAMLADDALGAGREAEAVDGDALEPYLRAFREIDSDPAHLLVVACTADGLVGTFQLSFLPGLSRRGASRAQIEAVRVHRDHRGQRLGEFMIRWAIEESGRRGCTIVQLTTDKSRTDAQRFYARLGFAASHEGMKLQIG